MTSISVPRVRFALGMAALLICGVFFLMTERDARRLALLEQKLTDHASHPVGERTVDLQQARALIPLAGAPGDIPEKLGGIIPGLTHENDANTFLGFLSGPRAHRQERGTTLMVYLLKKYPRLATVRFDDGLDQREREILAAEGEPFLKDVEALIRKGDVDHER